MNQGPQAPAHEAIYYPDGSCGVFDGTADCHKPGVVLAYDVFSPETRMRFCAACWLELHYDLQANYLSVVEDRREKGGET